MGEQDSLAAMLDAHRARLRAQPWPKRLRRWLVRAWQHYWIHGVVDRGWSFGNGVRQIIRWFPVIWNDRDDEDCYLLAILEFKLLGMANYFDKYWVQPGHDRKGNNWIRDVRRMRICAELCRRILDDDYDRNPADSPRPLSWVTQGQRDRRYLGYLLGHYSGGWWW
jgi:hypothetical protein